MSSLPTERHPTERLGLFFLIWTGCFLLFSILSQGFLRMYLGKEGYMEFINGTTLTPEQIGIIKYLQILLSIGIFGLPPLLLTLLSKPRDWSLVRLNRTPDLRLMGLTVLIVGFSLPVVSWALIVNQGFQFPDGLQQLENYLRDSEAKNAEFLKAILGSTSAFDFVINFIMIAIVPPIVEELLFRGALQQLLQRQTGAHAAIILSAAFFSFIHLEFFGFFPRFLLGILLGYLFFWSRNLWVPIFAHFIFNGLQVVLKFLYERNKIGVDIDQVESFPPLVVMGATVLLFTTLYIFDLVANSNKQPPADGERLGEGLLNK